MERQPINHDQSQRQVPPPAIETITNRMNALLQQQHVDLDPMQQRRALAYATVMTNPKILPELATYFNTTVNITSTYAREAMELPDVRQFGVALTHILETKNTKTPVIDANESAKVEQEEEHPPIDIFFSNLEAKLFRNLSKRESTMLNFTQAGISKRELAHMIDLAPETTTTQLSRLRKKIEKQELTKKGIERVAARNDNSLVQAVINGTLEGYMFLNVYYAYSSDIERFITEKKIAVDPEMLAQGYALVTDFPDDLAEKLYRPRYRRHLVKHNNVLYVPGNLVEAIRNDELPSLRDFSPPQEGMVRIKDWALSNGDYQKLWKAAKKGLISAEQNSSGWYALPEVLEDYLNSKSTKHQS